MWKYVAKKMLLAVGLEPALISVVCLWIFPDRSLGISTLKLEVCFEIKTYIKEVTLWSKLIVPKKGRLRMKFDNLWHWNLSIWRPGCKICKYSSSYWIGKSSFQFGLTPYLSSYRIYDTPYFRQPYRKGKDSNRNSFFLKFNLWNWSSICC